MQMVNFVLHIIVNFRIQNYKIVLVANFFLNINCEYDKFSLIFQTLNVRKKIDEYLLPSKKMFVLGQ